MADFSLLFPKILSSEGTAYENDPTDNGGCTKFGLVLDDVKQFTRDTIKNCEDVKKLTKDDAQMMYKKLYWDYFMADSINNQSLAEYIVDGAINQGKPTITKYVQQIVGVTVDGLFGNKTLAAINSHNPQDLFNQLKALRTDKYNRIVLKDPSQSKFINGWMNRVNSIKYIA